MIVTSMSFTSPRAGALKLIDLRSVFLIRTRAILRVGHTRVGAIAVVAATHGSFRMRRFKAALRSVPTRRRSRSNWRSGVSTYTAFRASTPCSIHFWESGILRSQLKIAGSPDSSASKLTKHISRRRDEGSGSARILRAVLHILWSTSLCRPVAIGKKVSERISDTARRMRALPMKFIERFDQIPRQRPHPIEDTLGNWFRGEIAGGEHFQTRVQIIDVMQRHRFRRFRINRRPELHVAMMRCDQVQQM